MQQGQFFRQKPANVIPYTTVELYHDDLGVLRYVFNQYGTLTATLEASAPRNASQSVSFEPIAGAAPEPEQGEYGASIEVQLGLAGARIKEKMNSVTTAGRRKPISVVWRRYFSDDLTVPAAVFYMQAANLGLKGRQGVLVAQQRSALSRSPWRKYKDDEFTGTATNA